MRKILPFVVVFCGGMSIYKMAVGDQIMSIYWLISFFGGVMMDGLGQIKDKLDC